MGLITAEGISERDAFDVYVKLPSGIGISSNAREALRAGIEKKLFEASFMCTVEVTRWATDTESGYSIHISFLQTTDIADAEYFTQRDKLLTQFFGIDASSYKKASNR